MSPVEFWWRVTGMLSLPASFEKAFSQPTGYPAKQAIIVVETQDEYDYCWSMQLMLGAEVKIMIHEPGKTIEAYLQEFSWVFTTWDPSDRNRI